MTALSPTTAGVDLVAERTPLGGLERWLDDPTTTDLLVNNGAVWVNGPSGLHHVADMTHDAVRAALDRILAPLGRRLDRLAPTVDARLPDGSRICAAIAPVAVDGTCIAIRRFADRPLPVERFAPPAVAALVADLVAARCNVLVSGATSSGKTTLLATLAAQCAAGERIVTLEDVAELRIDHPHVVRLESRPPTAEGVGAVDLAHLLRTALRLRPDRIVVGEVRGTEAAELLQALNTGHDGSLSTIHANGPADALARLATLVTVSAPSWPAATVAEQVARAVDVVVHLHRLPDGRRCIAEIAEVGAPAGAMPTVLTIADGTQVRGPLRRRRFAL